MDGHVEEPVLNRPTSTDPDVKTVVTLGASNLTRGFHTVVTTARAVWGPDVHVLAALGHGRSYGASSRVLFRTLPAVLDCGLWSRLETRSPGATRALVTDVGNDILYGFPADQVLAWVEEAVVRLQRLTPDITVTDLPLAGIRRLSSAKFLLFRSIFVPSCRLSLTQVIESAERVNAGLGALTSARGLRLCRLNADWYGFDPIHIRPSLWRTAWQEILGAPTPVDAGTWWEGWQLYFRPPERQWLCGIERFAPQSGVALASGAHVSLY
jgi:hypothetical protein